MTPDVADLQARVAYLSDELARAKMALASPGCGEACPVQRRYVEAAVRATIEACAMLQEAEMKVEDMDPAPIVRRVLGGGT